MPKSTVEKHYLISKHNTLNEIRPHGMTLQGMRLFAIYLSKINPKDESTKLVRFTLEDFQAIVNLESRGNANIAYYKNVIKELVGKVAEINFPNGGFKIFSIFKDGELNQDENGEWFVEIEASEKALPFMFNLQRDYFKYQLWNTLRLKSMNQLRMYEILKQYEKIGYRIISVIELKLMLGIAKEEYPQFRDFKRDVLNVCQDAISHYTDISFTYEPHGKKGRGGKIVYLKFNIYSNQDFKDPLDLDKFIETTALLTGDIDDTENEPENKYEERIAFFSEALENIFTKSEMTVIYHLILEKIPHIFHNDKQCYHFLVRKYKDFQRLDKENGGIKHKFKYFCTMINDE
ncbi:MAG: replication initiation protein [Defluviitaleaceae bacterium]|nr:replication initiation protein [Defluviitaleaceae bacterium]